MRSSVLPILITSLFASTSSAYAHVHVAPETVGVASHEVFRVMVPNESETASTTSVRLVLPEGMGEVTPNVKPGWAITASDKEIIWSSGSVPVGQRDEFEFSAVTPAQEGELIWKAYQTYSDGEVVAWDQNPTGDGHVEDLMPYSTTKVINDLAESNNDDNSVDKTVSGRLALIALVLSVISLSLSLKPKKG